MGISIAHWLASLMWDLLFFCLLHTIPLIIFYSTHSAISMAHTQVLREGWKKFEITKVWNNCLACHRGCAWWEHSCVTKMEHDQMITHKYRGSQQFSRVEYSTQICWFDTRGAKEYSQVLAAELSIQPHLDNLVSAAKCLVAKVVWQ